LKSRSNKSRAGLPAIAANHVEAHLKWPVYRFVNLGGGIVLAAFFLLLFLAEGPQGPGGMVRLGGREIPPLCPYLIITGHPCPGCGLTRALVLAVHGDMAQARHVHLSAPWVIAWCVAQLAVRLSLAARAPTPKTLIWTADALLSSATFVFAAYGPILLRSL